MRRLPGIPQDIRRTVVHPFHAEAGLGIDVLLVLPFGEKAASRVGGGAAAIASPAVEGEVAGAVLHEAAPFQGAALQFVPCAHGDDAAPGVGLHMASCLVPGLAAAHGRKDGDAVLAPVGPVAKTFRSFPDEAVSCGKDCQPCLHAYDGVMGLLLGRDDGSSSYRSTGGSISGSPGRSIVSTAAPLKVMLAGRTNSAPLFFHATLPKMSLSAWFAVVV